MLLNMLTPRLEIDLEKIAHNAKALRDLYGTKGISVIGVTKAVCGNPYVAKTLVNSGIGILADSRIENSPSAIPAIKNALSKPG
jgi:predicted amino acid racemase